MPRPQCEVRHSHYTPSRSTNNPRTTKIRRSCWFSILIIVSWLLSWSSIIFPHNIFIFTSFSNSTNFLSNLHLITRKNDETQQFLSFLQLRHKMFIEKFNSIIYYIQWRTDNKNYFFTPVSLVIVIIIITSHHLSHLHTFFMQTYQKSSVIR